MYVHVCLRYIITRGVLPDAGSLLEEQDHIRLKRCIFSAQCTNLPPVVTHNVVDENDHMLSLIRKVKLFNNEDDRVKVCTTCHVFLWYSFVDFEFTSNNY